MLDAIDSGNPVKAMRIDVDICMPYVDGWPAMARSAARRGDPGEPRQPALHATRPTGWSGRITAFNHPVMFAATRPLPALDHGQHDRDQACAADLAVHARLGRDLSPRRSRPAWSTSSPAAPSSGDALVTAPDRQADRVHGFGPTGLLIQRRAAESGT